jgi:phosphoglycerol transferase MdoB-like AlkP superfamily enzyme
MAWLKSGRLHYAAGVTALFFLIFVALRAVFYFGFSEVGQTVHPDPGTLYETLYIGIKFDLRLALILSLPVFLLTWLPRYNVLRSAAVRKLARIYIGAALLVTLLMYIIDFGHYTYLGIRMNSTVMRFFEDPSISANMMWQSYPVVWITLAWLLTTVAAIWLVLLLERRTLDRQQQPVPGLQAFAATLIVTMLVLLGLLGRFTDINIENPVPLRWDHAFFSGNNTVSALGINPVLFFYDTFQEREPRYDMDLVRRYYPAIADYLNVTSKDDKHFNYDRVLTAGPQKLQFDRAPNIILIMLESLGASRVSAYNNPLESTPTLDMMAENGWFFPNFYVPVSGTSRTVFASITGLPDVSSVKTATRNPLITEQRLALNYLDEHEKFYFIGGSAGWANMSALIQNSIKGVHLYQEGMYTEPLVDVWGISDLGLFREVDRVLSKQPQDRPFFAYIQTAANHRPFTVPEENDGFQVDKLSEDEVRKHGFKSTAQYNAVRLLDFNIGRFLEMAKNSGYLNNSIFVVFGDHNNRITTTPHMEPFYELLDLDGLHVPFMIYAPGYLEHRVVEDAVSLVDVIPTMAGWLGVDYVNSTMGRDINGPVPEGERAVYTQTSSKRAPVIGAITKNYMLRMQHDGSEAKLHDLHAEDPSADVSAQFPEKAAALNELAKGIYETTKFQFYHNTVGGSGMQNLTNTR